MNYDALIVGGGIIGCSTAYELAKAGRTVRVIDAGPAPGAGSTSSSSAVIRFHYSTRDGVVASWEAMHMWADWRAHLGLIEDVPLARFHRIGVLVIEEPGDDRRDRVLALFDEIGVPYEEWDARTIAQRAPGMNTQRYWPPKPVDDPAFWAESDVELDGYFTPDAGFVDDPQLAAQNLADAARRRGAEFSFNTRVTEIRSERIEGWTAQTTRAARRLPGLEVPSRPVGLAALYDVTPDWVPIYDRTGLDGYYVAIGTSGNQFKNAPLVGLIMKSLIDAGEAGHDHDSDPIVLACERTGQELNLGHYSRRRQLADTNRNVMG